MVPYIWERRGGDKHIVVIGTRHIGNPRSPIYDQIEAIFKRVQPQLVLHESVAPDDLATEPRDQAIRRAADMGFTVYLAKSYGVPAQSGDAPAKEEFKALLSHDPAEDVFVFLTAQRLIGSEHHPDLQASAAEYPNFIDNYLVRNGLPGQKRWKTWDGFLREYQRVVGRPLTSKSWNPDLLSPVRNSGRLSQLARASDTFRDNCLLAAIRNTLEHHDRVIVVFGSLHVLALKPALDGLLED